MTKLLKIKDAADLLSVHPKTLDRWEKSGQIKFVYLAGCRRITMDELERFVAANNPQMPPLSTTTTADLARHGLA
jgi:excisionase family DNA binding protein